MHVCKAMSGWVQGGIAGYAPPERAVETHFDLVIPREISLPEKDDNDGSILGYIDTATKKKQEL